jgi:hypothetical protein
MHRAERLMGNDAGTFAMNADVTQATEHMQRIGKPFTQAVFDVQAILQQQYFGIRCRGLKNGGARSALLVVFVPTSSQSHGGMSSAVE